MLKLLAGNQSLLINAFNNLKITRNLTNICGKSLVNNGLLTPHLPALYNLRNTSFFNKLPADQIWKGVTAVSNAGKRRGRGRGSGRIKIKDLNRGQLVGVGKSNIVWPGLSGPIFKGRELVKQQQLPEDLEREAKMKQIRDGMVNFKQNKLSSLERGWSGSKLHGRSIGPPDPIGEDNFEGFDSVVLEMKAVFNMKGNLGRKRRISVMVITGNSKGVAGFGFGKALENKTALRQAKNRSGQKLMHFELCDNRTVFHDFFCQFSKTKIFVQQKPEGYGLHCHRALKTICQVLGIKDLHANVEGPKVLHHMVKAFFIGMLQQKNFQTIAAEKGLHIVEVKEANNNFPNLIASPPVCRKNTDLEANEILDFTQHCMHGRIPLKKKKLPPFYTKYPNYQIYLKKQQYLKNQDKVRIRMLADEGEVKSFLTDKHPECRMSYRRPKDD